MLVELFRSQCKDNCFSKAVAKPAICNGKKVLCHLRRKYGLEEILICRLFNFNMGKSVTLISKKKVILSGAADVRIVLGGDDNILLNKMKGLHKCLLLSVCLSVAHNK